MVCATMSESAETVFWVGMLATTVSQGVPLLWVGLGELVSERAGVLNIGIEGMMLMGAFGGVLGAVYGGDGRTNFALPDMRGRLPVHQGTAPGLPPHQMGQRGGSEEVKLSVDQIPSHTHQLQASNESA